MEMVKKLKHKQLLPNTKNLKNTLKKRPKRRNHKNISRWQAYKTLNCDGNGIKNIQKRTIKVQN